MENINPENLIVRYLSKEASDAEQEELLSWIAKDPSNQKMFDEWLALWEKRLPDQPVFDLSQSLRKLNEQIDEYDKVEKDKAIEDSSFAWRKIAASVIVFLMACVGIFFLGKHSEFRSKESVLLEKTTKSREKTTVSLADGSVVYLNGESSIRFPEAFTGFKREVYLTGEAFFEVKKDTLRPFIIHTENLQTQVLGTSFNINSSSSHIVVTVATGRVRVSSDKEDHMLLPEEKITYSIGSSQIKKSRADLDHELAWRTNTIIFEDALLVDAVRKLEESFGVSITFQNKLLEKCLITGKYKNQSLEKILQAMCFSTGMKYQIIDKKIILSGQGCED